MSYVTYNAQRLIPAPFVRISKSPQTTGDGIKLGTTYNIVVNGTILAERGSPNSSGVFHTGVDYPSDENILDSARLDAVSRKIEALKQLFSTDGQVFSFQSANMATPITCNPRIKNVDLPDELWYQSFDYTITMEADVLYGTTILNDERFTEYISDANESWDINESDVPLTFSLNHSVSAVGKSFYSTSGTLDVPAWQYAKRYVYGRLGYQSRYFVGSILGSGFISFTGLTPFNYRVTENIDDLAGSYGVTESWVMSSGIATEDYTIRVSTNNDDSQKTVQASVDGSIRGYYTNLWDYTTSYSNAVSYLNNVVKPNIPVRISGVATGLNYISSTITYDRIHGILNYSYDYDNRPNTNGTSEEYSISQSFSYDNYVTSINIDGKITGLLSASESLQSLKMDRALARWDVVKPLLYSRAIVYVTGIDNIRSTPASKNSVFNPVEGSVQYNYSFNNRTPNAASDEYSVATHFSREQGFTTININGFVRGYDLTGSGNIGERFFNALTNFPTDTQIYQRALLHATGISFANSLVSKEVTKSPQDGSISYNYEYTSQTPPLFSGALYESINVVDILQGDVFAAIPVPFRIQGPVLQDIGTKTPKRREINIELVMPPYTGINVFLGYSSKPSVTGFIEPLIPTGYQVFAEPGAESWSWETGRFSYNRGWTYES